MPNKFCYSVLLLLLGVPIVRATELSLGELTTVSSIADNNYRREKLPDGSLKPVRYAFGEGTCDPGSVADGSLNRLKFEQLAVLLSAPLARLGYQPSQDVNNIDEVLVIHWGRTIGWNSDGYGDAYGTLNNTFSTMKSAFPGNIPISISKPGDLPAPPSPMTRGIGGTPGAAGDMDYTFQMLALQEEARARANARNALLLGYYDTLKRIPTHFGNLVLPRRQQLLEELEDDRYYVSVSAYDFQTTRKSRQPKLLWITRFSLQARGNDFDRSIHRMIQAASPYFGRSSNGLHYEQQREGHVDIGELKVLEYEESKK